MRLILTTPFETVSGVDETVHGGLNDRFVVIAFGETDEENSEVFSGLRS